MLFNILMFSGFYFESGEEKIRIVRLHEGYYHIVTIISEQMLAVQGIVYSILSLIVIKNYKRNIVDYHSNINSTVLSGFRTGILLALIAWIIGIVGANLEKLEIDLGIDLFLFVYMTFVIIIYLLSILVIRSPELFKLTTNQVMPFTGQKEIRNDEKAFTPNVLVRNESNHQILTGKIVDEDDKLNKQLVEYMNKQKPYLNPDLNLQEMADEFNITRHQLSAIINQQQKMNFNEFVNFYRVEEAKKLMVDPNNKIKKNYDLAFEAGFNSKASFYRIFKQITNQTPSSFRSTLNDNSASK